MNQGSDPAPSKRSRPNVAFWVLVALSVAALAAGAWRLWADRQRVAEQARPVASGTTRSTAPDFALKTSDGDSVRLSDLRGTVVLLNFWATWCPPCKAEMPDLDALHRDYGAEHNFTVIGINVEESSAEVHAFAAERNLAFPLLLDGDGRVTNDLFSVRSLPTSMIIGRDGAIRDVWTGQIQKAAMLSRLQRVW